LNDCPSFDVRILAEVFFVFVTIHAFVGQTDRRTGGFISWLIPPCLVCSAVKYSVKLRQAGICVDRYLVEVGIRSIYIG